MKRREFLKTLSGAGACALAGTTYAGAGKASKPNILLIFSDDMGFADVGYHGCKDIPTPNIDSIAKNGVKFSQAYVAGSTCGPSRCGLITGRYPQKFESGENPPEAGWPDNPVLPGAGVPRSEQMISEMLKPEGYKTGVIGKWHLGIREDLRPNQRGFDYYYGFLNGAHSYIEAEMEMVKNHSFWPIFENNKPVKFKGYTTDKFTDKGIQFIKDNKKDPFFLYVAYNAVHGPWQAPDNVQKQVKHVKDKDRRVYAGMLVSMDNGIGRLIQTLKDEGVYDDTMIIFMNDNGGPAGSSKASNGILHGYKGDSYEGGIRVPMCMSWKGKIKPGTTYDLPVSALDIAPTITARLGLKGPKKGYDGVDLLPYITGKKKGRPHEVMYWRRDDDYAIRKGDWKLEWNDGSGPRERMLFDLAKDPGEKNNLIKKHPELAQELQGIFDEWDSVLPPHPHWGGPSNRKRRN